MQESQPDLKHAHQRATRTALLRLRALLQCRFRQLQIPVAVLVPDELVERGRQEVEAIAREMLGGLGLELLQFRDDPAIGVRQLDRLSVIDAAVLAFAAHQYVARCIPDLVAEIAIDRKSNRLNSSHYCATRMPS